jgi:hypothetical protein
LHPLESAALSRRTPDPDVQVARVFTEVQSHSIGPDLFELERGLLANELPLVPRLDVLRAQVPRNYEPARPGFVDLLHRVGEL